VLISSVEFVGGAVHHFACDAGILNLGIPLGEAPSLLFFLFWSEDNNALCGFEQVLEMFSRSLPPARFVDIPTLRKYRMVGQPHLC